MSGDMLTLLIFIGGLILSSLGFFVGWFIKNTLKELRDTTKNLSDIVSRLSVTESQSLHTARMFEELEIRVRAVEVKVEVIQNQHKANHGRHV